MMFALILAPARAEQARKVAKEHGEVVFDQAGVMDSMGIRSALQQAARVAVDALILDIDAGPGPDLLPALQGYRIARPHTRIIVLAPGREPGDPTVAGLVGLGVYDIVAGPVEADWVALVGQVLARPPATYAQAARWHVMPGLAGGEQVKEKVVIQERPAGAVTIAVIGAAPGLGCTHTALAISAFLARQGHKVALVEDSQRFALDQYLRAVKAAEGNIKGAKRVSGIDIFAYLLTQDDFFSESIGPEPKGFLFDRILPDLRLEQYDYIIRDLGYWEKDRDREALRATLPILVTSAAGWRIRDFEMVESIGSYHIALIDPPEEMFRRVKGAIPATYKLSYAPDPFKMPDEPLAALLAPVLPRAKNIPKKSLWLWRGR
ncbi:MAG: hypothetical protein ACPLQP_08960 [Moorellaceae bacterium]